MDFELDDEQLELQRVVRDIAERQCPPALVRSVVGGSDDGSGLWKTFVQLAEPDRARRGRRYGDVRGQLLGAVCSGGTGPVAFAAGIAIATR